MVGVRGLRQRQRHRQTGFTFLWVLVAISILGIGLSAAAEVWVTTARQQRQTELEWIGGQFTQAIGSYYQATPGATKIYPKTLEDLLEDKRYPTVRRHLRTVYANPFSGKPDWEVVRAADGGIRGVRAVPRWDRGELRDFIYIPLNADQ
jgi:prepilin-type N-terminal cleavage/methylation domain-containing protein